MKKSLVKNSIYNIIYTIANVLFPFFTSIYVSRILLPDGVGIVAYAQNIASYFVTIAALGLPSYGVREFAKIQDDKQSKDKLFTELIIINFISTTVSILGFFVLLASNANVNNEWFLYITCGLVIFFNYFNIDWMYQGLEEYSYITIRSLIIKVLSFAALLFFVKEKQDYIWYALITSIATGGNYFFNVMHARKFVTINFKGIEMKRHMKPLMLIAGIIFLSTIYNKVDVTMLKMIATDESIGYYTYAQKTVNIVLTMSNAITAALLPRLSYYFDNDRNAFYDLLDKGFQILCFFALPLCMGLVLVAPQAVEMLYGRAFAPAAMTIRLMCPLILIKSFGDFFCYQLVYSTKCEKIIIPASGAASVLNVAINAVLIPFFLQNGAVVASVTSEMTTNLMQFIYIKKKIKFKLRMRFLLNSFFSTVCMMVSILIVMQMNFSNNLTLIFEIVIGTIVYITISFIQKNEFMIELFNRILKKS